MAGHRYVNIYKTGPPIFYLTGPVLTGTIILARKGEALRGVRRLANPLLGEEVQPMRLTLHIGRFTVTIIVKERKNRHSAK